MNTRKIACTAGLVASLAFSPALWARETPYEFETINIPGSTAAQAFDVNDNSRIIGIFSGRIGSLR